MKRIANIVFYKFNGERPNMKQACIFYTDGTVKNTSYEDGLEACQELVERYNITSKQAFKDMINNKAVYVMSGREFEERFQSFMSREDVQLAPVQPQKTDMVPYQKVYRKQNTTNNNEPKKEQNVSLNNVVIPTSIEEEIEEEKIKDFEQEENVLDKPPVNETVFSNENDNESSNEEVVEEQIIPNGNEEKNNFKNKTVVIPTSGKDNKSTTNKTKTESKKETQKDNDQLDSDFVNGLDENVVIIPPIGMDKKDNDAIEDEGLEDKVEETKSKDESNNIVTPVNMDNDGNEDAEFEEIEDLELDEEDLTNDENDVDSEIEEDYEEIDEKDEPKKENRFVAWIKRGIEKIKKNKLVKKITAFALAIAVGLGLYSCASRQTKEGQMFNSTITNTQDLTDELGDRGGHLFLVYGNNNHYDDYSYQELLKVTKSEPQKAAMTTVATTLDGFNDGFANAHIEEGKDVKAALTFEEMVALQQAYNTYSNDEIRAIFNGATIRSDDMSRNYKDANLQLMGAYVISTSENHVDMSGLINSEEGKAFYNKYLNLFLDAKEATGEDKLAKIQLFYDEVRKDFPITNEVRMEGIAHADDYATLEPYKLSVTPIISAAEIMFQNYKVDHTLNDSEIDFLNDLGLCNFADETFQRIETLTLTTPEDNKNPLYTQYRDAVVYMMKAEGNYYVDDEHRELTKLDAFQEQVNWHMYGGRWVYSSYTYTTTETHTETKTWTETETTTRVEETREEKPITEEAKQEVDEQIEKENEEARQEAEKEAEQNRQEMQEEADREAEKIEEEVKQDAIDLEEKIEDANEQIDQNNQDQDKTNDKPVNEEDLGHGVEFAPEHQDGNGNLNDSVENITTDPHGDETGMDFPDPNETGKAFDEAGEAMATSDFSGDEFVPDESKAAGVQRNVQSVALTDDQIVDLYIELLANSQEYGHEAYQYRKI